ncbi:MAG: D-alanyl-D-alanine carboxypeptidase/D-alanyl-D-alanine-endopeptidase [Deltaproteobacteria bacterium]|nr:D-alanyl-D-alanine carboxypeptidase/D-alanyl-D-alanine-endopeptidase [Deltaproteobacteria bacterium]
MTRASAKLCHVALVAAFALTIVAPAAIAKGAAPAKVVPAKREVKKEPPPRPTPRILTSSGGVDAHLKAALTEAINQPALDEAELGFLAVRVKDGLVLGEVGADRLINPASNAKLVTAATALHTLHAEHRFKTEYFVNGTLKDGTLHGNLVVKGYGDPTIVSERLMRVANELYLFGVERITGGIIVDGSWFDGVDEARGWEIEESPDRAYAAAVTALAVNFNATSIYVRPTEPGRPAVVLVDPPCEQVVLEGAVMTEQLGSGVRVVSDKDQSDDGKQITLLTVEGSVGARQSPFRTYRRVYAPLRHFGSTLIYFLQQRGVKVQHRIMEGPVPDGARLVLVDRSPPLAEVLADLNHYSNNIIAETIIKAIGAEVHGAPGTFDNGLKVARAFLEEQVGFAPGSYTFDNGSGLNDVNRFTARQMVKLLGYMLRDVEGGTEYAASLAVAGTQGTIGFRMRDTPAERRLRAKTGTLRGVSALSGYVADPAGDLVAFSVLSQDIQDGVSGVWQVQNFIGASLASNGAWRPEPEGEETEGETVSDAGSAATGAPTKTEAAPGGAP